MPEGTTLERTNQALWAISRTCSITVPEVENYQAYAGTASPITFNGLVRQYYLRSGANVGDLQVDAHRQVQAPPPEPRHRARRASGAGQDRARNMARSVKVVEVPPGPPVLAPIVAEVYGPDYGKARDIAADIARRCSTPTRILSISTRASRPIRRANVFVVDRARAARLGVSQAEIVQALQGRCLGHAMRPTSWTGAKNTPCRSACACRRAIRLRSISCWPCACAPDGGALVPISEVVQVRKAGWEKAIYHKDLLPSSMSRATMPAQPTARFTACSRMVGTLSKEVFGGYKLGQQFHRAAHRHHAFLGQVGRRMADHLRDLPRHGAWLIRSVWF